MLPRRGWSTAPDDDDTDVVKRRRETVYKTYNSRDGDVQCFFPTLDVVFTLTLHRILARIYRGGASSRESTRPKTAVSN